MDTLAFELDVPESEQLRAAVRQRLSQAAAGITPDGFAALLPGHCKYLLHWLFRQVGADEGTIWLVDAERKHLVPAYNTGPHTKDLVGVFRQPLGEGLVSLVFANGQSLVENEVYKNIDHSKRVDHALSQRTEAIMIVPFQVLGDVDGVISCVVLGDAQGEPRRQFTAEQLEFLAFQARVFGALFQNSLLERIFGL
ncbi:MAG: GAF domain-containing protein [Verrucomicrobia bacterium]|nr:GAF domain-containing protein [Verrucomicrobiota bacterium]